MTIKSMIVNADMAAPIPMPSKSVHCVVTSPPYYALRDYGETGQIGLENTIQEYIQTMVKVFQEVSRVLRDDGVCWVNIGDTYAGGGRGGNQEHYQWGDIHGVKSPKELKQKNMMLIPQRLIIALQDDGWIIRSDIIWHKPNPMPESVKDRPTKAHEHIFLLTKSPKYYYDAEAIKEPAVYPHNEEKSATTRKRMPTDKVNGIRDRTKSYNKKRNKRSVWSIPTHSYSGAHFATFPPKLPEICIKAGTSDHGVCSGCGAGWIRVVQKTGTGGKSWHSHIDDLKGERKTIDGKPAGSHIRENYYKLRSKTKGWEPGCDCNAEIVPAIVVDPFNGSGTTPAKAQELGRIGVGFDLSFQYCKLALERTGQQQWSEWVDGICADDDDLSDLPMFK